MSRHQHIRTLDYNSVLSEDQYLSDDGEEELSAEDQALMSQGTADVKAALGSEASKVTVAQIEEALWHYYYDIDKSVTYLVSKFINPPNPKAPKASKPQPPAAQTPKRSGHAGMEQRPLRLSTHQPQPFADFFKDMPWGNVPRDRESTFISPPRPAWAGLLGGSGTTSGMSKLQQLAAQRKKKAEEHQAANTGRVEQARTILAQLSLSASRPPPQPHGNKLAIQRLGKQARPMPAEPSQSLGPCLKENVLLDERASKDQNDQKLFGLPAQFAFDGASSPPPVLHVSEEVPLQDMAEPSHFARLLFGDHSPDKTCRPQKTVFSLPYLAFAPSALDAFSKPSPDDIVFAAQAQGEAAGGKKVASKKASPTASVDSLAADVKAVKIDTTPSPKSKHLDVVAEFEKSRSKKTASFVVVGHVDAGKSTMMGRLLLDMKVVNQRTVDKLRREADSIGKSSFALAWVLDQRTEERERGVTIDVATNCFESDSTVFTILDAPGHRDFIPNMIAGASQADFAILVVDASTGAFESGLRGQTREHSLLIRSMGVSRIIVAINKLDAVGWSADRFTEIKNQVQGFLTATGFKPKNIAYVPVSGLHGDNLVNRSTEPSAGWYDGPTLVEELEKSEPSARALHEPLRMAIAEVFSTPQSSTTIRGRVDAGSLQTGDAIMVQPNGVRAYIKSMQVDTAPADWAVAGHNVTLHLSNIDADEAKQGVRVGNIVCSPAAPVQCVESFTLKALAFDFLMPMQVDVHRGRLHAAGEIQEMTALLDKTTGAVTKRRPKVVKPASVARLRIQLQEKVPMEKGMRVVLRSNGETVAAGLLE